MYRIGRPWLLRSCSTAKDSSLQRYCQRNWLASLNWWFSSWANRFDPYQSSHAALMSCNVEYALCHIHGFCFTISWHRRICLGPLRLWTPQHKKVLLNQATFSKLLWFDHYCFAVFLSLRGHLKDQIQPCRKIYFSTERFETCSFREYLKTLLNSIIWTTLNKIERP